MEGLNLKDDYFEILRRSKGRDIVLFGTGRTAHTFLNMHGGHLPLFAVIDNDIKKQGKNLDEIFPDIPVGVNKDLIIQSPQILLGRNSFDTLVFVANVKPEAIIKQLEKLGLTDTLVYSEWVEKQEAIHTLPMKKPIKANKIFCHMHIHGSHEKAITQQLLKIRPDLDIVWATLKPRCDAPHGVRIVSLEDEYECWKEAANAHIWLSGVIPTEFFRKRSGQYYVQVKHWSSITLKEFGPESFYSSMAKNEADKEKINQIYVRNAERMDAILTGSDFDDNSCRAGFLYNGPFVRVGSPRSDCLFNEDTGKKIRSDLQLHKNERLALVAPTFRLLPHAQDDPLHNLDLNLLRATLSKRFGGNWRIMLRLHPQVAEQSKQIPLIDFVMDVSCYDDSEELVAASDVIITDYSSIMFEPAFIGAPVFLYIPDKEDYLRERSLLLDFDELPFSMCENNEALCLAIEKYDERSYRDKLDRFFAKHGVHEDGHASERAARFILDLLDGKVHEGAPRDELDYRINR